VIEISKKIIYILLVIMLCCSSVTGAITFVKMNTKPLITPLANQNYTHTVFCGVAATQQCGDCHSWNQNLYNAYESGDYDFEYVSMIVFDENGWVLNNDAENWSIIRYGITNFPTSIFDGDYQRILGDEPTQLPGALDACGNRTVTNITADVALTWLGNATVNITVAIQNNENVTYNGSIDVFITENVSRYNTSMGAPFRFGFLDFTFYNESISINASGVFTNSTIWNGNEHEDNHGDDFGDITKENIQVTMAVYDNSTGYVDETATAYFPNQPPNAPSNPNPVNGETNVSINPVLSWTCSDPENDPITYDVYFGNLTPPPKVVSNQSGTTYLPGTLNFETIYYWQIIAWDNKGASNGSAIWNFTTVKNDPPDSPSNPIPANGETNVILNPILSWTCSDPNGDTVYYDVYFEAEDPDPDIKVSDNQEETIYNPGTLQSNTKYYWKIVAEDEHGESTIGPIWNFTTMTNDPPDTPGQPSGPTEGFAGENLVYSARTSDPNGHQIYYWFDWGNGENSGWLGLYQSNETVSESYAWPESGEYEIRVKAKDIYDAESNWSEPLIVNISEPQIPQLEIILIQGGLFRITALIQNVGDVEATNVNWNISLISGRIFRGRRSSGTIPSISPGGIVAIYSKLIIGFGKPDIIVNVETPEGSSDMKSTGARIFWIFIWLLPNYN
jgi:hypothetical protein